MTETSLKIIAHGMKSLGLDYALGTYNKNPISYPYWTGEYIEDPITSESGLQKSTFILTGFNRGELMELEREKTKIKDFFDRISGEIVMTDDGSAVAIFYLSGHLVKTVDPNLKKIQINLDVQEWRV